MQKRYYLIIAGLLIFASVIVVLLLQGADLPNRENNGFTREIAFEFKRPIVERQLGEHVTRISGCTDHTIYFSGANPSWALKMDYLLNVKDTLFYGVTAGQDLLDPLILIDSPKMFMYGTTKAYLLFGNADSARIDTLKLESELITRVQQISDDRLIIRGISDNQTKQVFRLMDCKTGKALRVEEIVPSQQFGGFDADGFLRYDSSIQRVLYVQMYQNKIWCLDTALNVLSTFHTIDTTFTNSVSIGLVDEGGSTRIMPTKPRVTVNKMAAVFKNKLFVFSGLRADNESLSEFNKHLSIDIYDISRGKYIASMRLPKYDGKNVQDLRITDQHWIVLYYGGKCAIFDVDNYE